MNSTANEFPLDVDLSSHGLGVLHFRTIDEVKEFLAAEVRYWRWIPNTIQGLPNRNSVLQFYQNAWEQLNGDAGAIRTALDSGNYKQAANQLTAAFGAEGRLPPHRSLRGTLIESARQNSGEREALGVVAGLLSLRIDGDDPHQIRGVIIAHEFLEGTGRHARRSIQDGLANSLRSIETLQGRAERAADQLDDKIASASRRQQNNLRRVIEAGKNARTRFASEIDQVVSGLRDSAQEKLVGIEGASRAAIESIQATEKTYSEKMGLAAPVTYWRRKARLHRIKGWIAGIIGLLFATAISTVSIIYGFGWTIDLIEGAVKDTKQWQVAYVVLSLVVFLLTIIFWIGRILSRIFTSESHLTIDAEERAIMVETYLALTAENKISESERILVLGSLFRSTSDGLVKDEGAPDLSLAGLASRFGATPGPK